MNSWVCGRKLPALGRMGKAGTGLRSSDLPEQPPKDKIICLNMSQIKRTAPKNQVAFPYPPSKKGP